MSNTPTLLAASLATAFGSFATLTCVADPRPAGAKVVAGQVSISHPTPTSLHVQQRSAKAAIDWHSFNIGRDASVVFRQPSAESIVLNRVVGTDPSQILGRIQANGQVFLVNPYGIVFGRDAKVDVAGLVASTINIRNDDFMAGRLRFTVPGRPRTSVVNEGLITVREGGLAALAGPGVANRGSITARLGTVALASGDAFTLDPYGDRLIGWVVPASQLTSVVNEGTLSADGGSVQISARAAASVIDGVINLGGTVRARSVGERGGRIVLEGDAATTLTLAGAIDARGADPGARGGSVQASGGVIHLTRTTAVDASGDAGGGSVHLGAGWRGAGGSGTVAAMRVDQGAHIDVSAPTSGAGGEAVIWSDGTTAFKGRIDARGVTRGGQVEVSGHRLAYDGSVDAASAHGAAGTLLLDPGSLLVQSRSAAAPAAGTDVVTTESINTQLAAGTRVQLVATQDVTVADRIDARLVSAAGARVNATGADLALSAGANLALNSHVILDGGSFSASAGGRVTQASTAVLATGGGDVSVQAAQGIVLNSVQGARSLALTTTSGSIELATSVGLTGRFSADVMQAQAGDRVHLKGLVAASSDLQPAISINRASANTGAAALVIDNHLVAAGAVSLRGSTVMLAATKSIDTRTASGGRAGSAVTLDAGRGGLALNGNVYTENAAVALSSQGDNTQATAAAIGTGTGPVTLTASGTATVSRIQTTGTLGVSGARVVFDAGTTDTAVQAGALQVNATSTATHAVDVRTSIKLGGGNSTITSANDVVMQSATLIETGATGALMIDAARNVMVENLKSSGAGTIIRSAFGDVTFNQPIGGRAAGDTATVRTLGGDAVPEPTLYALDVRAPNGTIDTKGLLLYGLKDAPLTIDMPAPGTLANGLNLAADKVFIRGLVFVLDGAVSIQGATRLVIGNSIRSANGYAMSIGGGEINLYRPTRPDGTEYKNTDIIVAQYASGTLKYFEQLNGTWQESTSFLSVVMPADLSADFWLDRSQPNAGIVQAAYTDPAFASGGAVPVRLFSLRDTTTTGTNAFDATGLASYDPAGLGRNPYVPLVYPEEFPLFFRTPITAHDISYPTVTATNVVDVPGTRFVPKILITNDPGASFTPAVTQIGKVLVTRIGRLTLSGNVFETDSRGITLVPDSAGGTDSGGDLRYVALKVASFDTRSIFQDSHILRNSKYPDRCTAVAGTCLDDPDYFSGKFNDYPRGVYPSATKDARILNNYPSYNPTTAGFQAAGYLSRGCLSEGNCERPASTVSIEPHYTRGEHPNPGGNPNAPTTSLIWLSAQPSAASFGRFEYFKTSGLPGFAGPVLRLLGLRGFDDVVLGLGTPPLSGGIFKIGAVLTQANAANGLSATRTVLAINRGIVSLQGITMTTDGNSTHKTSLPTHTLAASDTTAPPTFSTITPTIQDVAYLNTSLVLASGVPAAPVYAPPPPPPRPRPQRGQLLIPTTSGVTLQDLAIDAEPVAYDEAAAASGALLVLGGRGLAQSVDLGRSGSLGPAHSASPTAAHEVACAVGAPAQLARAGENWAARRDTLLPPCR